MRNTYASIKPVLETFKLHGMSRLTRVVLCDIPPGPGPVMFDFYKTELCMYWNFTTFDGCPHGDDCQFVHPPYDTYRLRIEKNVLYKTVPCHNKEPCRFGDKCNFLHKHERRYFVKSINKTMAEFWLINLQTGHYSIELVQRDDPHRNHDRYQRLMDAVLPAPISRRPRTVVPPPRPRSAPARAIVRAA